VGDRRTVGRRARLCSSQAIGFSVHSRIRRPANALEPFASRLPDVYRHSLGNFECRTIDATNCQSNVKSVSFLVRTIVWAGEDFADLLQI
jgi:hypothetical protein